MKEIEVFFDGDCPLCSKEIALLQRLDKESKIVFTDIKSSSFDPSVYGLTFDEFMAEIRGRLPDGTMIKGVEVFRRLYVAVGFSKIVLLTRLPLVASMLEFGYRLFAKNRLRFTGRCDSNKGCKT